MRHYFLRMLDYNKWANDRAIESIKNVNSEKARGIMSHILDSQANWLVRIIDPEKASRNFWNLYSPEEMHYLSDKTYSDWKEFLNSVDDLDSIAEYTNSQGEKYTSSLLDILTHLFKHSAYHRGQVALSVRSEGGEPAATDYIIYSRRSYK